MELKFNYLNLNILICAWHCSRYENAKAKKTQPMVNFLVHVTIVLKKLCGRCSDSNTTGIRGTTPVHDKESWG